MTIETKTKVTTISINPNLLTFKSAVLWNLKILNHFAKYGGIPVIFENGKLSVDTSFSKRCLWLSTLFVVCLRTFFIFGSFMLSLKVDKFFNPLFTPLYLGILAGAFTASIDGCALNRHIGEFVLTWNAILKYKLQVKPPKLQVWLLHILPSSMYVAGWFISVFLALNTDWMIQFRFGVTWARAEGHLSSESWGYCAMVYICTLVDFWSFLALSGIACVEVSLHMLFMETWPRVIMDVVNNSKKYTTRIAPYILWIRLEELLVLLCIFNVGNASAIAAIKVACLVCSISSFSALILLDYRDNVLLLIIICYAAFAPALGYPALYYNAYRVSAGLQLAKYGLSRLPQISVGQALLKRRLLSVSTKGVWVGSLRTFERESVLIFVDFVVSTVMSIVLARK